MTHEEIAALSDATHISEKLVQSLNLPAHAKERLRSAIEFALKDYGHEEYLRGGAEEAGYD